MFALGAELETLKGNIAHKADSENVHQLSNALFDLTSEVRETPPDTIKISSDLPVIRPSVSPFAPPGLSVVGFVDASYAYDAKTSANTFGFDQVELDFGKKLGKFGLLNADLEWLNDGKGGFDVSVEQGYLALNPCFASGVSRHCWGAGIRTPIPRARVACLAVGRHPRENTSHHCLTGQTVAFHELDSPLYAI